MSLTALWQSPQMQDGRRDHGQGPSQQPVRSPERGQRPRLATYLGGRALLLRREVRQPARAASLEHFVEQVNGCLRVILLAQPPLLVRSFRSRLLSACCARTAPAAGGPDWRCIQRHRPRGRRVATAAAGGRKPQLLVLAAGAGGDRWHAGGDLGRAGAVEQSLGR
ncbi:hypothetical protein ABZP36_006053 [Zizania latifolia]